MYNTILKHTITKRNTPTMTASSPIQCLYDYFFFPTKNGIYLLQNNITTYITAITITDCTNPIKGEAVPKSALVIRINTVKIRICSPNIDKELMP